MGARQEPEVKGVWFVTARRHILQAHGDDALQAVARALAEPNRRALLEPLASAWYHEDVFQDALRAVMSEIARHDTQTYTQFLEDCTVLGVHSFFRVLLRITSPSYLMRKMPVLSKQYRRNDSECHVEGDEHRAILEWTNFSYFGDNKYRLYLVAMLAKTAELCTGTRPRVDILRHGSDTVTAQVLFR